MLDWADEAYWSAVRAKANADGEFARHAKFWEATVRLGIGHRNFRLRVDRGAVSPIERFAGGMGVDLAIQAPDEDWDALLAAQPMPFYQDLYPASLHHGFDVVGGIDDYCAHYPAIRRLIEIMREVHAGSGRHEAPATPSAGQFEAATGRYVHLPINGTTHRVYFEETGTGDVGLLMQHTAGADARQWRHVLEDEGLQSKFRLVAYDLPYHGKSVPPTDVPWWQQEYRLTRDFLMAVPIALASALTLPRPVYMGSSIGGHLAVDLALHHPREFRAVVGLEAAAYTPGGFVDEFNHPRIGNEFKGSLMYGMMAPTSPEAFRHETAWVYSQGAPPVFKGDLYYYSVDHDVRNTAATIDTDICSVDILNGEYDWSGTPDAGEELAAMIPGARYRTMPGLGHFPMSEHPDRFLAEIRPVLERILAAG
ncbi:MAG: alpha/beta hydrolase [Gammaproteobacteria bacterium]|nr:alpha/beta hydrolase [Gammaproteobacteria bacterium]